MFIYIYIYIYIQSVKHISRRNSETRRSFDKVRSEFTEVNTDGLREEERASHKMKTL